jgi:hypothetical protein
MGGAGPATFAAVLLLIAGPLNVYSLHGIFVLGEDGRALAT